MEQELTGGLKPVAQPPHEGGSIIAEGFAGTRAELLAFPRWLVEMECPSTLRGAEDRRHLLALPSLSDCDAHL
jgi:hypothetical protein